MSKDTHSDILKKNLLIALEKSLGIVTTACKSVGCHRDTYYEYMNTDEEFKKEVEAMSEIQLDFVETAHLQLIKNGVSANILYHLKTKGKKRGYQENVDYTTNGKDIGFNIVIDGIDENITD